MDVAHQCSWPVNRPCESLEQGAPRDTKPKRCGVYGVVMRRIRWCSLTHWYFLCTICSSSPFFNLSIILPSNFLQKVGTMVCMVNRHSQILVIVPPGLDAWWVCGQVLFFRSQWINESWNIKLWPTHSPLHLYTFKDTHLELCSLHLVNETPLFCSCCQDHLA